MPSQSRYQSHLFNFLNTQGQKLKDQAGLLFRQVKLSTVWGAQIALYPIYAMFQATGLADRQLRHTVDRIITAILPTPPAPECDRAITKLAQAPLGPSFPMSSLGAANISAIAADIQTRQLCLIDDQSKPIALTAKQQQYLQQEIELQLAQYWQLWQANQRRRARLPLADRHTTASHRSAASAFVNNSLVTHSLVTNPRIIADRPHFAAPIRLFYQLMAWLQRGQVAHQLNLFGESAIVAQPQAEWFRPQLHQLPIAWPQTAIAIQHPPHHPDLKSTIDWGHGFPIWQTLPDGVAHLIRSAVAYFFGRQQPRLKPIDRAPSTPLDDPWHSAVWFDRGGTFNGVGTTVNATAETVVAEFVEPTAIPAIATHWAEAPGLPSQLRRPQIGSLVRQVIGWLGLTRNRARPGEAHRAITHSRHPNPLPAPSPLSAANSLPARHHRQGSALRKTVGSSAPTTTWIEIPAEPVGYVQHPLVRVLAWLDRALAWIETQITNFIAYFM